MSKAKDLIKKIVSAKKSIKASKFVWKPSDITIESDKKKNEEKFEQKDYNDEDANVNHTHKNLSEEALTHYQEVNKKHPKRFSHSLHAYNNIAYQSINHHLRHPNDSEYNSDEKDVINEHIHNLKHLTKLPTKHTFSTYRGIEGKYHTAFKAGDTIHDKGFTSSSIKKSVANEFCGYGISTLFKIHVHSGVKGHYMSAHDKHLSLSNTGEHEFIFHPGTKFKVIGKHKDEEGNHVVDLHVHHQEE